MTFYLLDVFAAAPYQGNPLGVFTGAAALSAEQMLQIARELNFPETTFITGGSTATGFDVRIFTPEYEVPFAGHPTLGTAYVLMNHLLELPGQSVVLNLGVGPTRVELEDNRYWLQTIQPRFGQSFNDQSIAKLLHVTRERIDTTCPIEVVSTGLPYLIVSVRSRQDLNALWLQEAAFKDWALQRQLFRTNSPDGLTVGLYVFCQETDADENDLSTRAFFYENNRLVEDAATGSAGSCLLAYLLRHQFREGKALRLRVEQGYKMNRPSLLELAGSVSAAGVYDLRVGGQVKLVATGEWRVASANIINAV